MDQRTDDDLWLKVLGQIAVVGRAEPGERLQKGAKVKRQVSIQRLKKYRSDEDLQKYLHKVFLGLGVRYVGRNWKRDKKAVAAVKNFRRLTDNGNRPKEFFKEIARCKQEEERIEALKKELKYYGDKGARDTAIDLGLAKNCMALDVRIYGLLEMVGVKVSPEDIYRQIERELIRKVAKPLAMSGALLDRVLFQNYNQILKER